MRIRNIFIEHCGQSKKTRSLSFLREWLRPRGADYPRLATGLLAACCRFAIAMAFWVVGDVSDPNRANRDMKLGCNVAATSCNVPCDSGKERAIGLVTRAAAMQRQPRSTVPRRQRSAAGAPERSRGLAKSREKHGTSEPVDSAGRSRRHNDCRGRHRRAGLIEAIVVIRRQLKFGSAQDVRTYPERVRHARRSGTSILRFRAGGFAG